jgi:hypothetical protein
MRSYATDCANRGLICQAGVLSRGNGIMRRQPLFDKAALQATPRRMTYKGWIFEGDTHF